ncbi:hypothetical protein Ccrd_005123 [Cynara cardunculus var. scolymus]|uniref:Uncharacterized protein n=1 Tax=Cynara cardunculus var. scolymus TaxID=59895 RepID=A0A103XLA8_CYNCS|nr:hypothetical protein Ccrd_005123 [Cynara cardunculus var. scolymus]
MEPARGVWWSLGHFILFLPYFIGLLILGFIKGIILAPIICVIMAVGNSTIAIGLWPAHVVWSYFCILSAKRLGPVMKVVVCILFTPVLAIWPFSIVVGSILGGLAYGFLGPIFGTFKAVGEGKTDQFRHCIIDGTWDTVQWSFTFVRDLADVCLYSFFSMMDDLRKQGMPEGKIEIRIVYLPVAILLGLLGVVVDFPMISVIAAVKSPYMLFKGWHRLFQDCVGREGPFLETICVPFAGLAILLWPLAVAGALTSSAWEQESSFYLGLCYVVAAVSIYDEYSNDVLDMPEGSCFPKPRYRRNPGLSASSSFSRGGSLKHAPSRSGSLRVPMIELKPLEDSVRVITIGLPAYCLYLALLRSGKANSSADNATEITSANRPKDAFYDWFLNPLLVMKDQIKAQNLTESEEDYLGKLVLLSGDGQKLKNSNIGPPPELQGITKSISRYPTYRRRFENIMKAISEELDRRSIGSNRGPQTVPRSKSTFGRIFSTQRSFKNKTSNHGVRQEDERDVEIV